MPALLPNPRAAQSHVSHRHNLGRLSISSGRTSSLRDVAASVLGFALAITVHFNSPVIASGDYRWWTLHIVMSVPARFCSRSTRNVSHAEGRFLSANAQPFQARYIDQAV